MTILKGHEIIPGAHRLIMSLRDMGYDFAQAVADIVDNSIEAGASLVTIDIEFDGDNSWVRIADNGKGMTPEQLREAMRYGSGRDYGEEDLGKFGLGLKTASMSQCQCLSVASRWNRDRANIAAYSWDLEHIKRTNRWEILPIEDSDLGPAICQPLKETNGTVVLWRRLDRILGYKHPYGEKSRKQLSQMCREIEQHLSMVFHRFLSGETSRKRLRILINGNEVKPWDAFCQSEQRTKKLQSIPLQVENEGVNFEVLLQPFILPHQDDFSSPEAFKLASGTNNWNQQQGFYIYRSHRMIQSGGWCNLRAPDEHTKLARVAVNFSPALDEAFKINVAKMRVQFPAQIREAVKEAIVPVLKLAREIYDRKSTPTSRSATASIQEMGGITAPTPIHSGEGNSKSKQQHVQTAGITSNSVLLSENEWAERTLAIATKQERPIVEAVLARLSSNRRD